MDGWERAETNTGIPYYINDIEKKTQWDHPLLKKLDKELEDLDRIRFIAYKTAMKLRAVQKFVRMSLVKLRAVKEVLSTVDRETIDVRDAHDLVAKVYQLNKDGTWGGVDDAHVDLCAELMLNWLLNVYDHGRTGKIRTQSLKVGLTLLSQATLNDKYLYLFLEHGDGKGRISRESVGHLMMDMLLIPRQLVKAESQAFGGGNVDPIVQSCFDYARARPGIEQVTYNQFTAWLLAEPQAIVWLPTMHRLSAAESVKHDVKCNECKTYPMVGFRFRSMKHLNLDLCQSCFFSGCGMKNNMKNARYFQEYCVPTSSGEDVKDFARVLRNKLTKKHRSKKAKFIPIAASDHLDQSGGSAATPRSTKSSSEVHSEIGDLSLRLRELEETPPLRKPEGDEEHALILHYAKSLAGETPRAADTAESAAETTKQISDLEGNIQTLEDDKRYLQDELHQLRQQAAAAAAEEERERHLVTSEQDAETRKRYDKLRRDKERLEARIDVVEEHNRQLMAQLQRLRHILQEQQDRQSSIGSVSGHRSAVVERQPASAVEHAQFAGSSSITGNEETEIRNIVKNVMATFPDCLGGGEEEEVFGDLFVAAGGVGNAISVLVSDLSDNK
ncbi:dystrophin-like isoform X2 [Oscarella lobularis]